MALALKQQVRTTVYGTELWSVDKTGLYNASTNPGGWGAPNAELENSALLTIIKRTDYLGDVYLESITSQLVHNPGAGNEDSNPFGFKYITDGHYTSTLIRLRVSEAGLTDLEGSNIEEEDYFYMGGAVYQSIGGENVLVEAADYPDLLADTSLVSNTCEIMFYNKLMIKARDYYKAFKDKRDDASEDVREKLFLYDELNADISGADYNFRSGLKATAENVVKTLLEKHSLV